MKLRSLFILSLLMNSLLAQVDYISTDSLRMIDFNPDINPLVNPDTGQAGFKLVFWVHGLAGNQHSWGRVQEVTEVQIGNPIPGYPVRNVAGYALSYQGEEYRRIFGLATFVNNSKMGIWRNNPLYDTVPVAKNFAIAHSQGGIVSRAIRYQNVNDTNAAGVHLSPAHFSHLATFGTPNGGAYIINTTATGGPVQAWIDEGCRAFGAGVVQDFVNSKWWLGAIITPAMVTSFTNKACDGFNKLVFPMLVNSIRKPVGMDYAMGAPNLNELKSFAQQDNMKVVTFYGVEEEPVFWRVLHTMTNTADTDSSNLSGSILATNPFGLVSDQEFADTINYRYHDYISKKNAQNTISRNYNVFAAYSYFNPGALISLRGLANKASANARNYDRAAHWLGQANMNWKRFIGARKDTTILEGYYCECLIDLGGTQGYSFTQTIVQTPLECNPPNAVNCFVSPKVSHQVIEEPNDGVVTVSSQIDYPNAKVPLEMENTNHMQERNHEQTRLRLNELFNGDLGDEFKLDEK
ncbi:lipase family protein [Croceimicrobium hydrocarbonivorans]|uniref:Uncharacterized protein n=1 Tax=Croceimicrobium hydrocarbonivorans TaxID=2761580 RepID=A0A7H0VE18_9FLAO|nr:hypothetical protein [Croceimicrobium hydrocarbonivorans]QNR23966.1 hypothetical protein H4K34_16565 [Croceimicrobium hydrocarbonivorans]